MSVTRRDYPDGAALWLRHGSPVAGVGTDEYGRWTWWARSTQGRRVVASSREEAIERVERAAWGLV